MTYRQLQLERHGSVARIVLGRPNAFNALDVALSRELRTVLAEVDLDDSVRAVVLAGAGRAFCAGGDVGGFFAHRQDPRPLMKELVHELHGAVTLLVQLQKPVIVALHGAVAGAGVGLALGCDLAVAADSMKLSLAYTGIAASPDGGTTYFLARHLGVRRAMELVLTNRVVAAEEALALGLVNQVVSAAELEAASLTLAARLAEGATLAFARTKQLLWRSLSRDLETQLEAEGRSIVELGGTDDFCEGVAAFVEKRKPTFHGR